MVEYSISVSEYGHYLVPEVVVQAYHCEYIPEIDLLVVVLVAARSSDFDRPHPHNRLHNRHPP